jgi:hypothetical protein
MAVGGYVVPRRPKPPTHHFEKRRPQRLQSLRLARGERGMVGATRRSVERGGDGGAVDVEARARFHLGAAVPQGGAAGGPRGLLDVVGDFAHVSLANLVAVHVP